MVAFSKDPDLHKINQQLNSISHAMDSVGDRLGLKEDRLKNDQEAESLGHEILRDRLARSSADTRDGIYEALAYGVELAKRGYLTEKNVPPINSALDALQRTHHPSIAPHRWSDGTYHKEPSPGPGKFHANYAPHKQLNGSYDRTYAEPTSNVTDTTPTPPTSERLRTEESINTERREWKEVPRSCPIVFIGDLHGNFRAYEENMKSAGLIDSSGEWIGGNTKVIFVGDVLGDRNTDGFKIANTIQKLGDKAIHLAGNHEDFLNSALVGTAGGSGQYTLTDENASPLQYRGFEGEVRSLLPKEIQDAFNRGNYSQKAKILAEKREAMVDTLKKKQPDVLAYILSQKLCYRIHDHMVTHTPPTQRMVAYIFNDREGNVDEINNEYQALLGVLLTDPECVGEKREKAIQKLRTLQSIFLETGNSLLGNQKVDDTMWPTIRNFGINSWAYGHDSEARKMASHNSGTTKRDGATLIPVDTGEFKHTDGNGNDRSIAICDQQGKITVGAGIGNDSRHAYTKKDPSTGRTIARE